MDSKNQKRGRWAGKLFSRFFKICPRSGRIVSRKPVSSGASGSYKHWLFPVAGMAALVWFLVRVVPKPARAGYPCQRVAAPMASGFIAWIAAMGASFLAFRKARLQFKKSQYLIGVFSLLLAFFWIGLRTAQPGWSQQIAALRPFTAPVGVAKGTFPGRVVWAHNPLATNEACTNTPGDYHYQSENTSQSEVEGMVRSSLLELTGAADEVAAWDELFNYYNLERHGLRQGYQPGEEVILKVNLCSGFGMQHPDNGGSYTKGVYAYGDFRGMPDVTPALMLAMLDQLVNQAGVPQNMIYIGDPNRPFFQQFYDMVHPYYPDVHYLDAFGTQGRTLAVPTASDVIHYSDNNAGGAIGDKLPQIFTYAEYMINISVLKGHELAGITLGAKNHYGSQSRGLLETGLGSAAHLHYALPEEGFAPGYNQYRNLVDLMGHKDLGGKTLLSIVDGLWGGFRSIPENPNKWKSAPFNNDWPSSLFMSQDPVALDAVGFDFLREEYRAANGYPPGMQFPNTTNGVDDYLWQAASSDYWPESVDGVPFPGYDPEGDGTLIQSLGVLDRWNSPVEKLYTRNLDPVHGTGIELIKIGNGSETVIAVNTAGSAYTSIGGVSFVADDPSFHTGGTVATRTQREIGNTDDDILYLSERWGESSYFFNVAPGAYSVTLHFAETYLNAAGLRIFDVVIEGQTVINDLDIFAAAGGSNMAYTASFNVDVTDGMLNIGFTNAVADNPLINAIVVTRQGGSVNTPPVADAGDDQSVNAQTLVTLEAGGSRDPDNGPSPLTYHWTQTAGAPVTLSNSGAVRPTFTPVTSGNYSFTLTVSDGEDLASDQVAIVVSSSPMNVLFAVNSAGPAFTASNGVAYTADRNFSGGNTAATASAIGGTTDDALYQTERWGASSYSFPGMAPGVYAIRFQFAETYWSNAGQRVFDVLVEGQNLIDNLDIVSEVGGKNIAYDILIQNISVTDGTLNISFTNPLADQPKSSAFVVYAQDLGNAAPVADAGSDVTVPVNTSVMLNGAGSHDPDNGPQSLTYTWTSVAGYLAPVFDNRNSPSPSFTPVAQGLYAARLTVYDGEDTDEDIVLISVISGNLPPVANAGADRSAGTGEAVTLDGRLSQDPDNSPGPLTFAWAQVSGPSVTLSSPGSSTTGFTVPGSGTYIFELVVNDGEAQSSDRVTISVSGGMAVLFAVNSAGPAFTAEDGTVYDADRNFSGGNTASTANPIGGTNDGVLYRTERWGTSSYSFPGMAPGTYAIKFQFAETYWTAANMRKFDVLVEGRNVIDDLDVFAAAGGKDRACDLLIENITVADGILNISFANPVADQPKSSAFVVYAQDIGNVPPAAKAGPDQSVRVGSMVTLNGSGSSDPDNGPSPLTYQWTQIGGPAATLSNPAAVSPTFTPTAAGTYQFSLVVSDGEDVSAADSVTINMTDAVNVLLNGDFSSGFTNWSFVKISPAAGGNTIESGAARISIDNQGANPWDIQLFQVVTLEAAKRYTLSFDLKGEATPKNFKVVVEHGADPWTKYYDQQHSITAPAGTFQRFTVSWIQPATDNNSKIGLHFATFNTSDVWIDNAVLIKE